MSPVLPAPYLFAFSLEFVPRVGVAGMFCQVPTLGVSLVISWARRVKVNGAVRTWKRDANRIEVPVKYGMYLLP